MGSEAKTLISVIAIIALTLTGVCAINTYNNSIKFEAMATMVAKGANPQSVACAFDGINQSNQQVCITIASVTGNEK